MSGKSTRSGGGAWDAAHRQSLEAAMRAGDAALRCPGCGSSLARHPLPPPPDVAYVRKRILLVCPSCHRSGGFDVPAG